jgi:hypothetical protein
MKRPDETSLRSNGGCTLEVESYAPRQCRAIELGAVPNDAGGNGLQISHLLQTFTVLPRTPPIGTMEDEQDAELRNPFPSPPSHYINFTTHNLKLLSLLKERAKGQEVSETAQREVLSDQSDVPDWPLTSLEKPRVDWIKEDGYYNIFGDQWFVRRP